MAGFFTPGLATATLPLTGNELIPADTQLTQGLVPESEAISVGQLMSYAGLPYQAARFYGVPKGATPGTLLTVTATLYAYPVFVPGPSTIKTIGLYTTTGQTGGAGHAGIYKDSGGYPGALIANSDTGALIATSGAAVQTYTPTTALSLVGGWYWLASIFTASGTFPTVASVAAGYASETNSLLGSDTALHLGAASAQAAMGITVAGTYGALPTTFTTGAALRLNADVPLVILGT